MYICGEQKNGTIKKTLILSILMLLTAFNYLNAQDNTSTFNMTLEQAKDILMSLA